MKRESKREKGQIVTVCPKCLKICKGKLYSHFNKVILEGDCPDHRKFRKKYFENAEFYTRIESLTQKNKRELEPDFTRETIQVENPKNLVTSFHIYVTYRCNLKCSNCFANSKLEKKESRDVDVKTILQMIHPFDHWKKKPMLVLIGGEPTVRKDLFEIIKLLTSHGYNVRMATNGIRLLDLGYSRRLHHAGLTWIILQFDGFNPVTSIAFRGVDLTEKKFQVIENAKKANLNVHLATMVSKTGNLSEIYRILKYAFHHPAIFGANLYPLSTQGRTGEPSLSLFEIIEALEDQSGGTITRRDFLKSASMWNLLFRFTKNPIFRQKICDFRMFLYEIDGKLFPISRLFSIKQFVKHPREILRLFLKIPNLFRWSDRPTKDFLYFNIENFFDSDCIDLKEAFHCHNLFLTEKGCVPFCIYNSLYLPKLCG